MLSDIAELLSHPLVLQSAWRRITSWYESGAWPPIPEHLKWQVDPSGELLKLAKEFASGTYKPYPFRLVPYPKKGGILRHYALPTIRDQVAFAAFGVLLAPILEAQMPNFSFGNRWYRAVYRRYPEPVLASDPQLALFSPGEPVPDPLKRPLWSHRLFSLSDSKMYQPYARSHGLFRRVAHWTATAMLRGMASDTAATDIPKRKEDYAPESLPRFSDQSWWYPGDEQGENAVPDSLLKGYWAHLDLQLAYPSLSLTYLAKVLPAYVRPEMENQDLLFLDTFSTSRKLSAIDSSLCGYPTIIASKLAKEPVRVALAEKLIGHLQEIEYEPLVHSDKIIQKYLWIPAHVPIEAVGRSCLPTGLAISGLLMNVALLATDARMAHWMSDQREAGRATAFLRFADDMTIVTKSIDDLAGGIDELWNGLSRTADEEPHAVLARPSDSSKCTNLRINWAKIEPESLAGMVSRYLIDQGWQRCVGCLRPATPPFELKHPLMRFADWCKEPSTEADQFRHQLDIDAIRPDNLGPFMTYLVERLSALGNDTLRMRFGKDAQDHIVQLHELVRFDLRDGQVKEDTRLSFAANRLARAWLVEQDVDEDRRHLKQIRRSIQIAVGKAPWKYSLWRAVVQAAARRPPGRATADDEVEAEEWLRLMLKSIAFGEESLLDLRADQESALLWKEDQNKADCWDHDGSNSPSAEMLSRVRREFTLSFLRAAFWRALGQTIQILSNLKMRLPGCESSAYRSLEWRSEHWTFRALSEREIEPALVWLSKLDRWCSDLYPLAQKQTLAVKLTEFWWERDAIAAAMVSCLSRDSILSHLGQGILELTLPSCTNATLQLDPAVLNLLLSGSSQYDGLVQAAEIVQDSAQLSEGKFISPWLTLLLAAPANAKKSELAAAIVSAPAFASKKPKLRIIAEQIRLSRALQVQEYLPLDYVRVLANFQKGKPLWWVSHRLKMQQAHDLEIYGSIRSLALSIERSVPLRNLQSGVSLHELLWGGPSRSGTQRSRALRAWSSPSSDAPALGLPVRVALAMLRDAMDEASAPSSTEQSDSMPPNWLLRTDSLPLARLGRMVQLGVYSLTAEDIRSKKTKRRWIRTGRNRTDWNILPHPALYWPVVLGFLSSPGAEFDLWCHVLLFYTALQGSERFLDSLMGRGPGAVPLKERLDLRGRLPLSADIWELLDRTVALCGFRPAESDWSISSVLLDLGEALGRLLSDVPVSLYDFRWERVDVLLDLKQNLEVPQAILPFAYDYGARRSPNGFKVDEKSLVNEITVRVGQLRAEPAWGELPSRFPALTRAETQRVMAEVWGSLFSQESADGSDSRKPSLIIFPEVTLPRPEIDVLQRAVRDTGVGVFGGLLWRVVPSIGKPHKSVVIRKKFFVNEGLLSVPLRLEGDEGPPMVRSFFIEKPIPAAAEHGLARLLSSSYRSITDSEWVILPGRRWFRFLHPAWGDFAVAICSDLLDASPWVALRGEIMHLFMCAHNPDVELYEALTWVRAYENYVNMVSVNHGSDGGSFAWSPQRGERKEIAKLRGGGLLVTADVVIPVKSLWEQQRNGLGEAVEREAGKWLSLIEKTEDSKARRWKTPPPEFPARE